MKKQFKFAAYTYYGILISAFFLILVYIFRVAESYYAFCHYRTFVQTITQGNPVSDDLTRKDQTLQHAQQAIRHDRNNAEYYHVLGDYLHQYYADSNHAATVEQKIQGFREADELLRKAVMLNPAYPWYYYQLGRLSHTWRGCAKGQTDCPTERYFLAALQNAPNDLFLRIQLGFWYYSYDREQAFCLIQEVVTRDPGMTRTVLEGLWQQIRDYATLKRFLPEGAEVTLEFAQFLYDKYLDYESEREFEAASSAKPAISEACDPEFILSQSPDNTEIELGHDDGTSEWRTYLASEQTRVKKEFCLPHNLDDYNSAALKILMNNGGSSHFAALIFIDNYLIKQYNPIDPVPRNVGWYEIPFNISILKGKARISVYIRVTDASGGSNYLQIKGDQDTPTTHSVFNQDTTDDLSFDKGIQTGEYMIRLVLRK